MATEKQLLKLESIQNVIKKTPNKDVPKALSRGRIGYEKAIRSIMVAGEWAVAIAMLSVAAIVIFLIVKWNTVHGGPRDYEIYLSIFGIITSIISGVLGYKLWNLETTPIFALFILLFNLIVSLLLSVGILPILATVADLIALFRYSTFCSWFAGIK